jgi:excinuclease UvrABC nuclease subunit
MEQAARDLEFERAASLRDELQRLEALPARTKSSPASPSR